jgi:hypothetical protein
VLFTPSCYCRAILEFQMQNYVLVDFLFWLLRHLEIQLYTHFCKLAAHPMYLIVNSYACYPRPPLLVIQAAASSYNVKKASAQLEKTKEEIVSQNQSIQQEIECPRCHDVMTLHSEFDRLGYFCEECCFSLHLNH